MKTLQNKKFTFSDYWDRYSTITILVIMVAVFGALRPNSFLTSSNLIKIMEQSSITILLGLGEFFAILLGGIDLSVSSTMALSGALTAQLMVNAGLPPIVAILIGVVVFGAAIGMVNGFLCHSNRSAALHHYAWHAGHSAQPCVHCYRCPRRFRPARIVLENHGRQAVQLYPRAHSGCCGDGYYPDVFHGQAAGRAQPVCAGRQLSVCLVCGHHGEKSTPSSPLAFPAYAQRWPAW